MMNRTVPVCLAVVALSAALSLAPRFACGQAIQQGSVVEMNSGGRPLAGVAVTVVGAIPTDTDGEGRFSLVFSSAGPGSRVVAGRIYKSGYEIVNDTEVKAWVLSEKVPFKIVMAPVGQLEESRRNFYDIGRDRYFALYNDARRRLEAGRAENSLSERQYADSLAGVVAMYEDNMRRLDYYADKFSRINRDELNDMDARALAAMEHGRIEEAIAVYEEAEILRVFRDKSSRADSLSADVEALTAALERQAELLVRQNDAASWVKADSIMNAMLAWNRGEPGVSLTVARLQMSMSKYAEAYDVLSAALPLCRDMEAGERLAAELLRAARYLDAASPEAGRLRNAGTLIDEWRYNRAIRMF